MISLPQFLELEKKRQKQIELQQKYEASEKKSKSTSKKLNISSKKFSPGNSFKDVLSVGTKRETSSIARSSTKLASPARKITVI